MVEGSGEAIKSILTTGSAYFPAVLGVVAGFTAFRAVINFIRSAS